MAIEQIGFTAGARIREVLSSIGRTEDVRFSPDNRLLAIAGYGRNRCLILQVSISAGPRGPAIALDDFMELTSDSITAIHGIDFIADRTIAVANRDGLVAILELPSGELRGRECKAAALREIRGGRSFALNSPGSIAARRGWGGITQLYVCNNYTHQVTRHLIGGAPGYRVWRNKVVMERGLNIPDGVAISRNGRWIAISSHGTRDVKIFSTRGRLSRKVRPVGVLRSANYPHGLRFTAEDRRLLVADAGSPSVFVYEADADGGWTGEREPSRSLAVLDDETFARGHENVEEGGPKGLDIDRTGSVVAITCEEQTLAFYPLAAFLGNSGPVLPDAADPVSARR
jgi:hypothetical protein